MCCTLPNIKMTSWSNRAAIGFVAGLLLGCAAPPGEFGKLAASAPAGVPVPGHVAAPALGHSASGVAAVTASSDVLAQPVPTTALVSVAGDALWTQRGRTSWYGKQFNGRRTASGERFNAMALTAAHRSLPIPSYARVRVVGSGKEVVVRINDRGPFHGGRVLDVSYAAARHLGILGRGTALVDIAPLAADYVPTEDGISDGTTQGVP